MNPLTNVKNITKLNEIELARGTVDKKSWHDMYKESAWIFIGGLAYGLTEGDILAVFSQYGEIVNINLIRDAKTGKIKGFCFLCYANQKSTVLAVDNFNGIKLCGRTIRVDHVSNYKPPKDRETDDDLTKQLKSEGCAPKPINIENTGSSNASEKTSSEKKKSKKSKKEKKKHKKKKKRESQEEAENFENVKVKEEKVDPGYDKNELSARKKSRPRKEKSSDSSDSESSSSESEISDSSCQQLSQKKTSHSKHKTSSGHSHREKYESHNSSKTKFSSDDYGRQEVNYKEKSTSKRDCFFESDKGKRYQDEEPYPRSDYDRSFDKDRKRKYYDEENGNIRSDSHRKRDAAEYKATSSKHQRRDSSSSSDSDSEQGKSRAPSKKDEKYRKSRFEEERYSKSGRKNKDSPQRKYDRNLERKSKHDRDRR